MALQTFTAGQVLTAAQVTSLQSNDFNQTVATKVANYTLVAADKGTRVVMNSASATTITVNTGLFSAGDTLFIQNIGAGLTTITAGTATVTTASTLIIPQWGGGTLYFTSTGAAIFFASNVAGMELIKTQTIGSAVSTVTVNNAFSAKYTNYKIIVTGGVMAAENIWAMRMGGTVTGYYGSLQTTTFAGVATNAGYSNTANLFVGAGNTNAFNANVELGAPFEAKPTVFAATFSRILTNGYAANLNGFLNDTTSYTDFTLVTSSTFTGGTIYVYGYAG